MPAVPLNIDVGLAALLKDPPAPENTVQVPVPTVGVFADSVTVVKPQVVAPVWSEPASAVVGAGVTVTTAVLFDDRVLLHVQPVKVIVLIVMAVAPPFASATVENVPVVPLNAMVALLLVEAFGALTSYVTV